jgi:hypothetical protein
MGERARPARTNGTNRFAGLVPCLEAPHGLLLVSLAVGRKGNARRRDATPFFALPSGYRLEAGRIARVVAHQLGRQLRLSAAEAALQRHRQRSMARGEPANRLRR